MTYGMCMESVHTCRERTRACLEAMSTECRMVVIFEQERVGMVCTWKVLFKVFLEETQHSVIFSEPQQIHGL